MKEKEKVTEVKKILDALEVPIHADELTLILRAFPAVNCPLEAQRYVRRVQTNDRPPHPLYVLRDFERWLMKAKTTQKETEKAPRSDARWGPLEEKLRRNLERARNPGAGRPTDGQPLPEEEIENEVAYHRRRFFGEFG